jgi:hypothetical protein
MELDGDATNENLLKSYLGPKGDKVRPVPLSSSPPPRAHNNPVHVDFAPRSPCR